MTTTAVTTGTDHHPTAWCSEMKPRERSTFWACIGSWFLDAMDVQILSFAISAIIAAFAITNADAGLIGTATLLTSAFGAALLRCCAIAPYDPASARPRALPRIFGGRRD